jgi:hypothetical protein
MADACGAVETAPTAWAVLARYRKIKPYDPLPADLKGQTRPKIEYCGLACEGVRPDLDKNERAVKMLSSAQVRPPI